MQLRAFAIAFLTVGSFVTAANAITYNFVDTTFNNGDWIGVKYADTSLPPGSFTAAQAVVGGSALTPGPQTPNFREIGHTFGGPGAGAINVTHMGVNYNWSPLPLETATTVDYSYDLKFFDPSQAFGAVGFSPAIFQGGNVYRLSGYDNIFATPTNALDNGWERFSGTGIPLTSFVQVNPATAGILLANPSGSIGMSFGFVSANSANQSSVLKVSGIDDFRFTLNTVRVPEPTTLTTLAAAGLLIGRRRRQ
jgi:hypothetical protein